MAGKLYGIGVGPGDPELLTVKAIKTIKNCDLIAIPRPKNSDRTAFCIVEQYLAGKSLLECSFSMDKDEEKRKAHRVKVAEEIIAYLQQDKTIGFVTLGDPAIYSTYMYVHNIVSARGFKTEIIPGVTSFSAVSAALNTSLCEGNERLHIIPASYDENNIEDIMEQSGNKVIMKSGKNLKNVLGILKQKGLSDKTKIVERCTMEGERIFNSIEEFENAENVGYFTVAIVKE